MIEKTGSRQSVSSSSVKSADSSLWRLRWYNTGSKIKNIQALPLAGFTKTKRKCSLMKVVLRLFLTKKKITVICFSVLMESMKPFACLLGFQWQWYTMGECNSIGKTPGSVTTESETWGNVGEVSDQVAVLRSRNYFLRLRLRLFRKLRLRLRLLLRLRCYML